MSLDQMGAHSFFDVPFHFPERCAAITVVKVVAPPSYASVQATHQILQRDQGKLSVSETFGFFLDPLDGLFGRLRMGIPFPALFASPHLKTEAQKVE